MYQSLVDRGHPVIAVDASLQKLRKLTIAAATFSRDKDRWRSKFRYGTDSARTAAAVAALGKQPVDVILQIGATYDPPGAGTIPYAIYCDWNMALSALDAKAGGGRSKGMTAEEYEALGKAHARRYEQAAGILTISERLRRSFIELYGIAPERVHTVYAGPNFDMKLIEQALAKPRREGGPAVLFIAKEFKRKGADIVAAAFARLRETLPEARLMFAGAAELPAEFQGLGNVEHLGLLDKAVPEQLERLLTAYRDADVLVLPSRQDPFPTVIREAMFFGLPCVASDIWAMPEMIADGETGFLVPVDDSEAVAARLKTLFADNDLRARMGRAARQRAEAMFSWGSVGKAMSDALEGMRR
jgi:glycosyltransferase involved in cell wall biosynthesis